MNLHEALQVALKEFGITEVPYSFQEKEEIRKRVFEIIQEDKERNQQPIKKKSILEDY